MLETTGFLEKTHRNLGVRIKDSEHLAKLAKGSLILKVKTLAESLRGRFASHHALLRGRYIGNPH